MQARGLRSRSSGEFRDMERAAAARSWMGWKFIPNETGTEPLISYGTLFPTSIEVHEAWTATSEIEWHPQSFDDNPTQSHIVNALYSLPVIEMRSCIVWQGSKTLHLSKVRRLV